MFHGGLGTLDASRLGTPGRLPLRTDAPDNRAPGAATTSETWLVPKNYFGKLACPRNFFAGRVDFRKCRK